MTINGARRFRSNDGKSYLIQDTPKQDIVNGKGKYILTVNINGIYKLCFDSRYNVMYFSTIKEAQREVFYGADFIQTI